MILLFLGSWRSTLIVVISIPLSILVSITLLVRARPDAERDDAGRHGAGGRHPGRRRDGRDREHPPQPGACEKPLVRAILDGAQEIAVPAFVSTLCICIVFVPVAFITGAGQVLFVPLALAVVFAMLTSLPAARTLVPTLVQATCCEKEARGAPQRRPRQQPFGASSPPSTAASTACATGYGGCWRWSLRHRAVHGRRVRRLRRRLAGAVPARSAATSSPASTPA